MRLKKFDYGSAVFFGVAAFVMYLVVGLLQWSLRDVLMAQGYPITWMQTFVITPVVGAIVGYLSVVVVIAIYNFVARKYPISWETKK